MPEQVPGQPLESPKDAKARARAEKAYRKASRPFYKKKRVLLPLGLLVLIIIISVSATNSAKKSDQAATSAAAKTCAGKSYPDQQPKDVCADASNTATLSELTVTATPFVAKNDDIGGKALCSNVSIANKSGKSQDYNELDFKVQTPSGDVATASTVSFAGTLGSGTIINGATKKGLLCTDNKGEKGTYVLIYKPNPFESNRAIWLFKV